MRNEFFRDGGQPVIPAAGGRVGRGRFPGQPDRPRLPPQEDEAARLRADFLGYRQPCPRPPATTWLLPAIIGGGLTWALLLTSLG